MNMVARSYLDASSLQMCISDKAVLCNLKNDVVSCDVVQRDGRKNARSVVGEFIHNFRDLAIRYCKNWFTPTPPILVFGVPVVASISVRADLDPVNGEAFRRVDVAINGKDTAAMI